MTCAYNGKDFTLEKLNDAISEAFKPTQDRQIKIITGEAGMDMFYEAMKKAAKDFIKNLPEEPETFF